MSILDEYGYYKATKDSTDAFVGLVGLLIAVPISAVCVTLLVTKVLAMNFKRKAAEKNQNGACQKSEKKRVKPKVKTIRTGSGRFFIERF
jgi:hypothetical protein